MELVIVLLLIMLNGVFAMSELAIVSSRTSRLQSRADEGSTGARAALKLADDPSRFLSTVQIGIVTGAFGGARFSGPFATLLERIPGIDRYSSPISVIAFITCLSLIVGELVPKRVALQNPESIAVLVAPAMTFLSRITAPLVAFLAISGDALIRFLGVSASTEPEVTEAFNFERYRFQVVDMGGIRIDKVLVSRRTIESGTTSG